MARMSTEVVKITFMLEVKINVSSSDRQFIIHFIFYTKAIARVIRNFELKMCVISSALFLQETKNKPSAEDIKSKF